jgi:hypothetical protein
MHSVTMKIVPRCSNMSFFCSNITFRLFSLLLPLELHFQPPFSTVILYEYGWNRSLPHTLRSVPTQKTTYAPAPSLLGCHTAANGITAGAWALDTFLLGKIHPVVILVRSTRATCFRHIGHLQALNMSYLKLKIKCIHTYIHIYLFWEISHTGNCKHFLKAVNGHCAFFSIGFNAHSLKVCVRRWS